MPPPEKQEIGYDSVMTVMLDQAIESLRSLPFETQDDPARMLLQFADVEQPPLELTAEEDASLEKPSLRPNAASSRRTRAGAV
jgi:hypothetical protein